jgi:hypothetical protein
LNPSIRPITPAAQPNPAQPTPNPGQSARSSPPDPLPKAA